MGTWPLHLCHPPADGRRRTRTGDSTNRNRAVNRRRWYWRGVAMRGSTTRNKTLSCKQPRVFHPLCNSRRRTCRNPLRWYWHCGTAPVGYRVRLVSTVHRTGAWERVTTAPLSLFGDVTDTFIEKHGEEDPADLLAPQPNQLWKEKTRHRWRYQSDCQNEVNAFSDRKWPPSPREWGQLDPFRFAFSHWHHHITPSSPWHRQPPHTTQQNKGIW